MAKFPTMDEFAKSVAEKALDVFEYEGKTIRQWAELIMTGEMVEVVRCKCCEYQGHCEIEDLLIHVVNCNNPYCSYGERKDDGK